ncbi:sigma-70 family RNA polymerase sigma factor [Brevundimonas diminuta]|uniref:sigma-70 family RNA polymerase sigma factor n=1 Tax=Brevundimonas diminuta TaxID=293 RepID=UPI002D80346B|nr:sigma-70 family RNA polymerase sigma factor [Brevundimonas diminuta]MDA1320879.1 sigma-70 family RNA polymerase sigma factor [Pseudomonadota bacterium]
MTHHFDEERARWLLREILPHEPALRAWLMRRRVDGLEPDDVIQEAYSQLAARDRVDDIRHPRAYLFQTARSLLSRHVRRLRVIPLKALDDVEEGGLFDDAPSPEQAASDRDALRRLAEAIAALPPQARRALILRRVHDLPQQEIARRMGLSENTVEKHIARGIRLLIDWRANGGKVPPHVSSTIKTTTGAPDGRKTDQPTDRRSGRRLGRPPRPGCSVRG